MTAAAIAKPAQIMMLARSTLFGPLLEPQKVARNRPKFVPTRRDCRQPALSAICKRALTMGWIAKWLAGF